MTGRPLDLFIAARETGPPLVTCREPNKKRGPCGPLDLIDQLLLGLLVLDVVDELVNHADLVCDLSASPVQIRKEPDLRGLGR